MNYTDKEISEAAELYPYSWMVKHDIKTSTGISFEFEKRRFWIAPLNDLSPKQVWFKPPQVGASETTFAKLCYVIKKKKKDAIYTLPSQSDTQDMVGGKFNRIIAQNPILRAWTKDHDTIEQKKIGDNILYLRGTIGKTQAMMVSSAVNVHDELDSSDASVIVQYETRQEAQEREEDKWRWMFSHPSLAGHGVDIYWALSDQKEFYIMCSNGHEHYLQWPNCIDMNREIFVCEECKIELTNQQRINGKWINKDGIPWDGNVIGGYEYSGFHISQLMLFNKTAKDIIRAFNDPLKDKQYFYNYVLGLPYIGSEDRIEPSVVLRNCIDQVNEQEGVTIIGADTSHGINYVLMNHQGVFYFDRAEGITASHDPYDDIRKHLRRFPKSRAVFDQGGDLIGVRKLQAEYPGRVFLCFYRKDRKTTDVVQWGDGDKYGEVYVDRNRMLTLVVEQLRDTGRIRLNGTKDEWAEFAAQFNNIYREKIVVKETKDKDDRSLYGAEYVWKRNGHDDYVHALLYAIVGLQKDGGELAKIVGMDDGFGYTPRFNNIASPATIVGIERAHGTVEL